MEFVDNIKKTAKKLRGVIRESVTGDPNQSIRDTIEARVTGDRELLQRRRLIREKEKKEKAARAAAISFSFWDSFILELRSCHANEVL